VDKNGVNFDGGNQDENEPNPRHMHHYDQLGKYSGISASIPS
jgi:hypothetical protein